jgi:hypothetical protein
MLGGGCGNVNAAQVRGRRPVSSPGRNVPLPYLVRSVPFSLDQLYRSAESRFFVAIWRNSVLQNQVLERASLCSETPRGFGFWEGIRVAPGTCEVALIESMKRIFARIREFSGLGIRHIGEGPASTEVGAGFHGRRE